MSQVCISSLDTQLEGYSNIKIYPKAIFEAQVQSKLEDAECTELICEWVLEFYEFAKYEQIIACLARKARYGCKMILSIISGRRLADKIFYQELNNEEGNKLVFGDVIPHKSWIVDIYDFTELLNRHGINVLQTRIEDYRDIFVCQKQ